MANSGKAARSAPSSSARARAPVIRSTLPSMSPTTVSSWHRATRTRDTTEAYRRPAGPAGTRLACCHRAQCPARGAGRCRRTFGRARRRGHRPPSGDGGAPRVGRPLSARTANRRPWPTPSSPWWPPAIRWADCAPLIPAALDVLDALDRPVVIDGTDPAALARSKRLELLRIAARDLLGMDALEDVGRALADMAAGVLEAAWALATGRPVPTPNSPSSAWASWAAASSTTPATST